MQWRRGRRSWAGLRSRPRWRRDQDLRRWRPVAERLMRPNRVEQPSDGTPTGPSNASFFIHGILGGRQVHIDEVIDKHGAAVFRCSVSGQASDRWLEVPAWMFDRVPSASWRITDCSERRLCRAGHPGETAPRHGHPIAIAGDGRSIGLSRESGRCPCRASPRHTGSICSRSGTMPTRCRRRTGKRCRPRRADQ